MRPNSGEHLAGHQGRILPALPRVQVRRVYWRAVLLPSYRRTSAALCSGRGQRASPATECGASLWLVGWFVQECAAGSDDFPFSCDMSGASGCVVETRPEGALCRRGGNGCELPARCNGVTHTCPIADILPGIIGTDDDKEVSTVAGSLHARTTHRRDISVWHPTAACAAWRQRVRVCACACNFVHRPGLRGVLQLPRAV